jgi:hypothetical protein
MAVTLATTTLAASIDPSDPAVTLVSASGVVPGMRLYIDRELMVVLRVSGTIVSVSRGHGGTATTPHGASTLVTLGTPDQFYMQDPVGPPPADVLVTPWINVVNGTQWVAQGDETGPNQSIRWWAPLQVTHDVGALGVRTAVSAASALSNT